MTVKLVNHRKGNEKEFESKPEAEDKKSDMVSLGVSPEDLEIIENGEEPPEEEPKEESQSDQTESESDAKEPEVVEPAEPEVTHPEDLSKDPIGFLQSVNSDFVNTIKGKPAISKQGFRFIQREFEISTESKVVEWSDDPLGCIVWAKAELPNGYSAEAHGEGYQFESDVSDNEFVRYADTRAKNRAISDLTSAGALAVSELQGES